MLEPHLHTLAALIAEQSHLSRATPASLATIWRAVCSEGFTFAPSNLSFRREDPVREKTGTASLTGKSAPPYCAINRPTVHAASRCRHRH